MLLAPHFVAAVLHLPPLGEQAANYVRLADLLAGGLGMLYVVSRRLNATGFVFASSTGRSCRRRCSSCGSPGSFPARSPSRLR
jgi:hypothetical protein